jgi:predicted enzyme related to lactoylglutathione lyase
MELTTAQPPGTPTWIDLGVPDLDRATDFYGALFGWEFDVGPEETGRYTLCRLRGKAVAGMMPDPEPENTDWNLYFATDDCDATVAKVDGAGGRVLSGPLDVMDQGRMAVIEDPTGASFCLWQARHRLGCELVNEPGTLLRNDLVTPDPEPARRFYATLFDFTLDGNPDMPDMPDMDFTFLRRPDGHEIGGILGDSSATRSRWGTLFQVSDTDEVARRAVQAGGSAEEPFDMVYGRLASITDPFGTEFQVGSPS